MLNSHAAFCQISQKALANSLISFRSAIKVFPVFQSQVQVYPKLTLRQGLAGQAVYLGGDSRKRMGAGRRREGKREFSEDSCDIAGLLLRTPGAPPCWGGSEEMGGHASELAPREIQAQGHLLTTPTVHSLVVLVSGGVNDPTSSAPAQGQAYFCGSRGSPQTKK